MGGGFFLNVRSYLRDFLIDVFECGAKKEWTAGSVTQRLFWKPSSAKKKNAMQYHICPSIWVKQLNRLTALNLQPEPLIFELCAAILSSRILMSWAFMAFGPLCLWIVWKWYHVMWIEHRKNGEKIIPRSTCWLMTVLPSNRFLKSTILRFNRIVSGDCTAQRSQINDHFAGQVYSKKVHQ